MDLPGVILLLWKCGAVSSRCLEWSFLFLCCFILLFVCVLGSSFWLLLWSCCLFFFCGCFFICISFLEGCCVFLIYKDRALSFVYLLSLLCLKIYDCLLHLLKYLLCSASRSDYSRVKCSFYREKQLF